MLEERGSTAAVGYRLAGRKTPWMRNGINLALLLQEAREDFGKRTDGRHAIRGRIAQFYGRIIGGRGESGE